MYATNDVIVETDDDMMGFTQSSEKSPTEYSKAVWNRALQTDPFYEYRLKGIFIEGLPESNRHIMILIGARNGAL